MADASTPVSPRTFISYSWSNPSHESWVLMLASRLRSDGVDVVLDKWDLKPGHDSIRFMESMVTDPAVTKVVMICDAIYCAKADSRSGGVGTESQIISPEVYASSTQDKFAAVITAADEAGKPCLTAYYKGRIYFDFQSGDHFEDAYEQLLRWLIDRPLHVKPKLGTIPEALLGVAPTASVTQSKARRAEEAIRTMAANASGFIKEYGNALILELRALAPLIEQREIADEKVIAAVQEMQPYLRQFVSLCTTAARYCEDLRVWQAILLQLERIGKMMWREPEMTNWHSHQFDAFKIIAHDLFVSALAVTLEEERFDLAAEMLARPWLLRERDGANRPSTSDFTAFNQSVASIENRNRRLNLNHLSLQAHLLRDAHPAGSSPPFEAIMQADFVLFVRSSQTDDTARWYPFSLVYATDRFTPFSLFAKAESASFLSRLAPVLAVRDAQGLTNRLQGEVVRRRSSQMFQNEGIPVEYLANTKYIATRL